MAFDWERLWRPFCSWYPEVALGSPRLPARLLDQDLNLMFLAWDPSKSGHRFGTTEILKIVAVQKPQKPARQQDAKAPTSPIK